MTGRMKQMAPVLAACVCIVCAAGSLYAAELIDDFDVRDVTYMWAGNYAVSDPAGFAMIFAPGNPDYTPFYGRPENGYAYQEGVMDFRIDEWGNNALIGLRDTQTQDMVFSVRDDVVPGSVHAAFAGGDPVDTGLLSSEPTVCQIEYDLAAGTATIRARGDDDTQWVFEQSRTFSPSGGTVQPYSHSYSTTTWTYIDYIYHTTPYLLDSFDDAGLSGEWEVSSGNPSVSGGAVSIAGSIVRSVQEKGFAWGKGIATFTVGQWGNNTIIGLQDKDVTSTGGPEMYFRNDFGTGTIIAYGKSLGGNYLKANSGGDTGIPSNASDFVGQIEFDCRAATATWRARYGSQTEWSYENTVAWTPSDPNNYNASVLLQSYGSTSTTIDQVSVLEGAVTCGDIVEAGAVLTADLNGDCYVEWADFGIFASQWQECNDPQNSDCN